MQACKRTLIGTQLLTQGTEHGLHPWRLGHPGGADPAESIWITELAEEPTFGLIEPEIARPVAQDLENCPLALG